MINIIIQKLVIFFVILVYFYVSSALLMLRLDPHNNFFENLSNAYVWTLFGGIGGEDFKSYKYAGIAIIFGTIIITVILLNILIAFLSNLFSRLEEQQSVNDLKEKASMILDLEILIYFFKYKLTGMARKLDKYDKSQENIHIKTINPEYTMTVILLFLFIQQINKCIIYIY